MSATIATFQEIPTTRTFNPLLKSCSIICRVSQASAGDDPPGTPPAPAPEFVWRPRNSEKMN